MVVSDTRIRAIVLGSGAGGGIPQWNCGCRLCRLARAGDEQVRPATQVGVAVSADGSDWVLAGASPDLRQQILSTPALWPRTEGRDSPIAAVVLTGGDVDALAGLLVLREGHRFRLYAPQSVLEVLAANRIFDVLDQRWVERIAVAPLQPVACGADLTLTLLPMPGKTPLYLEDRAASAAEPAPVYAARLEANDRSVIVAPACADITDAVLGQLDQADVLFFDGTLFHDDEMITAGLSDKTGKRMGHVSLNGADGTLRRLRDLPGRRILLHINNTNPILLAGSAERRQTEAAGFEIAYDGMEVRL